MCYGNSECCTRLSMLCFIWLGFSLATWFKPNENRQKPFGIFDRGFRDTNRIFGVFLEILVRQRTELSRTWKGNIKAIGYNRNKSCIFFIWSGSGFKEKDSWDPCTCLQGSKSPVDRFRGAQDQTCLRLSVGLWVDSNRMVSRLNHDLVLISFWENHLISI